MMSQVLFYVSLGPIVWLWFPNDVLDMLCFIPSRSFLLKIHNIQIIVTFSWSTTLLANFPSSTNSCSLRFKTCNIIVYPTSLGPWSIKFENNLLEEKVNSF
jgi:hypothetical protein